MIAEHFDAIKARIELGTGLAGKVYDTLRLDSAGGLVREQYVILRRPVPVSATIDRLAAVATLDSTLTFYIDVRVVGTASATVGLMAERVQGQLIGHRLSVSGRSCAPLLLDDADEVKEDQSVKPFMFYADMSFELVSEPA